MASKLLAAMIGGVLLLAAGGAWAGTDYYCVAQCQQQGYSLPNCRAACQRQVPGDAPNPVYSSRHGTDLRCVDRCTGTGRPRNYCVQNCSY